MATYCMHTDIFSACGHGHHSVRMNPDRSPLPRVWPLTAQFIKPATQEFGTQVQI